MFEQDYVMRIVLKYAEILRRSWFKARESRDFQGSIKLLEEAVSNAVDMDSKTLLSLSPESIANILQVSGADSRVCEYVARSLLLMGLYLKESGQTALAVLREQQAQAIAFEYGIDLPDGPEEWACLDEIQDDEPNEEEIPLINTSEMC